MLSLQLPLILLTSNSFQAPCFSPFSSLSLFLTCIGMFRPEMLRPMGLPEDVVVIAWGLSLER